MDVKVVTQKSFELGHKELHHNARRILVTEAALELIKASYQSETGTKYDLGDLPTMIEQIEAVLPQ